MDNERAYLYFRRGKARKLGGWFTIRTPTVGRSSPDERGQDW